MNNVMLLMLGLIFFGGCRESIKEKKERKKNDLFIEDLISGIRYEKFNVKEWTGYKVDTNFISLIFTDSYISSKQNYLELELKNNEEREAMLDIDNMTWYSFESPIKNNFVDTLEYITILNNIYVKKIFKIDPKTGIFNRTTYIDGVKISEGTYLIDKVLFDGFISIQEQENGVTEVNVVKKCAYPKKHGEWRFYKEGEFVLKEVWKAHSLGSVLVKSQRLGP